MGDMGDMGDMGNMGALSLNGIRSGAAIIPNRTDFPLNMEPAQTWALVGGKGVWTPVGGTIGELPNLAPTQFKTESWSPNWIAWLTLASFAQASWTTFTLSLWDPTKQDHEIELLLRAATDERADALAEIVAQNDSYEDIMAYFVAMMGLSPRRHPTVLQLLHVPGLVGLLTAMHYKASPGGGRLPRPRPTMVCPALLAAVSVPGHPSFPSGHATQSMLMALVLLGAMQTPAQQSAWQARLQTLAWRIGRNREIAGLHYPSDSLAGTELAQQSYTVLSGLPGYAALNAQAGAELAP